MVSSHDDWTRSEELFHHIGVNSMTLGVAYRRKDPSGMIIVLDRTSTLCGLLDADGEERLSFGDAELSVREFLELYVQGAGLYRSTTPLLDSSTPMVIIPGFNRDGFFQE